MSLSIFLSSFDGRLMPSSCFGRCCRPPSTRFLFGLLTLTFIVRDANSLQHWLAMLTAVFRQPFWVCMTIVQVIGLFLPTPGWLSFVPVIVIASIGSADLLMSGLHWVLHISALASGLQEMFYDFFVVLLRCWLSLVCRETAKQTTLRDWVAAAVLARFLLRLMYKARGMHVERRRARTVLEAALRMALQRPFKAVLSKSFVTSASMSEAEEAKSQSAENKDPSLEAMEPLVDERKLLADRLASLLEARRQEIWDQFECDVMLPQRLSLTVRRDHLLADSIDALLNTPTFELLAPSLSVTYVGEEGVDAGGLTRDWFHAMSQELVKDANLDGGSSLLVMGKSSKLIIPRPSPASSEDDQRFLQLLVVGRFIALCITHGFCLPLPLSHLVCKYIVGEPVDMRDVRQLDRGFHRERILPLLEPGGLARIEEALGERLTFVSVPTEMRPQPEELELGGSSTLVTSENLPRYIQLLCEAYLCHEIRRELQCLLQGFWDVFPLEDLQRSGMSSADLFTLLSDTSRLDVDDWQSHSYDSHGDAGSDGDHAQNVIAWFWAAVKDTFNEEQRRMLLRFVTGSGRLPIGGFGALNPPFSVVVSGLGSPEHLPQAQTCINQLMLRCYTSPEQLTAKLLQALPTETFNLL